MDTPHQGSFSTDHCKQQGARWTAKGSAYLCLAAGRVGAIGRRGVLAVLRPIWSIALIDTLILRVINRAATPSSTSDQERCPNSKLVCERAYHQAARPHHGMRSTGARFGSRRVSASRTAQIRSMLAASGQVLCN